MSQISKIERFFSGKLNAYRFFAQATQFEAMANRFECNCVLVCDLNPPAFNAMTIRFIMSMVGARWICIVIGIISSKAIHSRPWPWCFWCWVWHVVAERITPILRIPPWCSIAMIIGCRQYTVIIIAIRLSEEGISDVTNERIWCCGL